MNTTTGAPGSEPGGTTQGQGAPQGDLPPQGPTPHGDSFWEWIDRLGLRRTDDRWVSGTAGGVARRLGLDPLLVRGIWFVLCLVAGAGLVLYAIAWALLPDDRNGRSLLRDAVHGQFRGEMVGPIVAFILGVNWRLGAWSWWRGDDWIAGIFWLCLLAGVAVIVAAVLGSRGTWGPSSGPQYPGAPQPPSSTQQYPTAQQPTTPYPTARYPSAPVGGAVPPAPPTPGAPTASFSAPAAPSPAAAPYAAAPYAAAPYGAPASVRAPQPLPVPDLTLPTPPLATKDRRDPGRRRGSGAVASAVVGLCLVAGAVVFGLDRGDHLSSPWLVWGGVSLVLLGLGIVVAGLRGRGSGGLTTLAILLGVVVLPAATLDSSGAFDGDVRAIAPDTPVVATDVTSAEDGYTYSVGDLTVDLTGLPLPAAGGTPVEVPVKLGAGDTTIQVPQGAEVRATVHLFAGDVDWLVGPTADHQSRHGGHANRDTFETAGVAAGGTPQLVLDISSGAGTVTIEEK
ncbi:PspC domain-containing protein [Luteimicrobium sp. DT211]|uniref:PspC domain-containing protein n=1 Tax=Luteimicrobium sp. DT211 TaxID=3393412 RepID=UPI003CE6A2A5